MCKKQQPQRLPQDAKKNELKINKIEITEDKISGRGGLALFLRYVEQINFYKLSDKILEFLQNKDYLKWK